MIHVRRFECQRPAAGNSRECRGRSARRGHNIQWSLRQRLVTMAISGLLSKPQWTTARSHSRNWTQSLTRFRQEAFLDRDFLGNQPKSSSWTWKWKILSFLSNKFIPTITPCKVLFQMINVHVDFFRQFEMQNWSIIMIVVYYWTAALHKSQLQKFLRAPRPELVELNLHSRNVGIWILPGMVLEKRILASGAIFKDSFKQQNHSTLVPASF